MNGWIVAAMALVAYPAGRFLRGRARLLVALMVVVGFLPFVSMDTIDVNLFTHRTYHGEARGVSVTLIDFALVVLAFALPKARYPAPFRAVRWLYLATVVLSLAAAPMPLYGFFSVWRLLTGYLALVVVARACEAPRLTGALLTGLSLGVVYQAFLAISQRYSHGGMQAQGSFSHPNSLGMAVNLVFPIVFALLLAGAGRGLAVAAVGGAVVAVILTLSRGSLVMMGVAATLVYCGSFARRASWRKLGVAALAGVAGVAMIAKSYDTIAERFHTAPPQSIEARQRFEIAAAMMLRDHPLGVGINNYSYVLGTQGYWSRAGVDLVDRNGIAHQTYWLTAAELGPQGLLAYLLVLAAPLFTAIAGAVRARRDVRGDVLLGCAAGLTAMYFHALGEWIPRQAPMVYLFWMIAGLVATLARQVRAPVDD